MRISNSRRCVYLTASNSRRCVYLAASNSRRCVYLAAFNSRRCVYLAASNSRRCVYLAASNSRRCVYLAASNSRRCVCPLSHCGSICELQNSCVNDGSCVHDKAANKRSHETDPALSTTTTTTTGQCVASCLSRIVWYVHEEEREGGSCGTNATVRRCRNVGRIGGPDVFVSIRFRFPK